MGCPVLYVILLPSLLCLCGVQTQDLRERDALCREDGCFVLHFQRKIFLEAWRSCKEYGGNLATIRHPKEAAIVKELFSNVELRQHHRGKANIWIGLQRQPRQCSPTRPLRGFSWVTGDQDTQYTNWLQEDSASTCSSPRCVVMPYSTAAHEQGHNLKWKDGPCSISVDGYLCRYNFQGMCTAIASEGGGNTLYSTPFNLLSTLLTHIPYGSVAAVPCPAKEDQSVLCTQKEDGTVGWNREPPFCSDTPKTSWCDKDNGGCHHFCVEDDSHYYCDCNDGYLLAEDGVSCFPSDPCNGAPCEFECLRVMDGYRCACPDGYMLAPDERGCIDVDECLQSPCEHICVNAPGTFECRCRDGYRQDEEGACEDVDECSDNPCEHACENTLGSHICHCHLGFAPLQEDQSQCHDIDECQIEGTCEQMCINYDGGFECYCEEGYTLQSDQYSCRPIGEDMETPSTTVSNPWITHNPIWEPENPAYPWHPPPDSDWNWQTELPNVETVPTDLISTTEEEPETTIPTESSPEVINVNVDLNPEQPVHNAFFPPAILTPTPDYYEDESTTVPTVLPSSTASGGAWNWLWFSSTQTKPETQETAKSPLDLFGEYESYEQDHDNTDMYDDESTTFGPGQQTSTRFPMQSRGIEEVIIDNDNSSNQSQGTSWLLIGLLVPLCIFIVVMVVLGIIYCTRYTIKPQNKNTSDCYHWIAGAGDKAATDISGSVTKSHV
ncbi:CD248 molecule, endosialin a [Sinocyclocheilus rhinocerous]|uniref:CD248 molecule, endosialin a n=1 Tax=Sinocyclocheilus rhinocerous TaxID=307959 RepID=UPI0007B7D567|nr:PREDICTED: endosialin-like [Sinocyclocheilus rhinocerous]